MARQGVTRLNVGPTDHDEMICEFRAAISGYQIQPKNGSLNLGLLIAYEFLKDDVLDLGRHVGMELVVQVYKPMPRPSILDMARADENPVGEDGMGDVVSFVASLQTQEEVETRDRRDESPEG